MPESLDDMFGQTTGVMTQLLDKAREAREAGASRREFFAKTAVLAGASALGAAGAGFLQPVAALAAESDTEAGGGDTTQTILNIAATAESLATTFYYNALASTSLPHVNSKANRNYFQAAAVQEFEHLRILGRLGGEALTKRFYFPDDMFVKESVFFPTASTLEDYFIAAYLAAAIEFSGAVVKGIPTANPVAIGAAFQIGGTECEHRALLRVAANENPPNNVIVETALLKRVGDAVAALTPFLQGGAGFSGPYSMPSHGLVNEIAQPFGFGSFPKYKVV